MFNFFIDVFNITLYKPLFNALILFYDYIPGHDFGIAVIVLTAVIRILLFPLSAQGIRSQKALQKLQPKIKEIQEKYKKDKEKQAKASMELYQKEKVNPFSGCLPLLIQLPILFALYRVFWRGLQPGSLVNVYSFIPHPGQINPIFLGFMDLGKPSIALAIVTGITQFFQTKMTNPRAQKTGEQTDNNKAKVSDFSNILQNQMLYLFPAFMVLILLKLPAALALYLIVTGLFTILQQYLIFKKPDIKDV